MKKIVKILFILLMIITNMSISTIKAEEIKDTFSGNNLNGFSGIKQNGVYCLIEITSGEIDDGVVTSNTATLVVSPYDGYVIDHIEGIINSSSILEKNTFSLNKNDVIDSIDVYVDHTEIIYNSPITITVPTFRYGLELNDISILVNDEDLQFKEKNLFKYDYSTGILTPSTKIEEPGFYVLFMVFDSISKTSYLADESCNYLNTIYVSGAYSTLEYVAMNYDLSNATRSCSYYDHTKNIYLCPLSYFYMYPLSVSYNENGDSVTNMPSDTNTYIYGQPITISTTVPLRDGYSFLGWSLSPDGEIINEPALETGTSSVTLYARWSSNSIAKTTIASVDEYKIVNTSTRCNSYVIN